MPEQNRSHNGPCRCLSATVSRIIVSQSELYVRFALDMLQRRIARMSAGGTSASRAVDNEALLSVY